MYCQYGMSCAKKSTAVVKKGGIFLIKKNKENKWFKPGLKMTKEIKITIKDLSVSAHLGMTVEERKSPQEIRWTIQFSTLMSTEPLVCYQGVSDKIQLYSQNQNFSSMEELVVYCHRRLKTDFPKITSLFLKLHKVSPPLKGLSGGVFLEYGDK